MPESAWSGGQQPNPPQPGQPPSPGWPAAPAGYGPPGGPSPQYRQQPPPGPTPAFPNPAGPLAPSPEPGAPPVWDTFDASSTVQQRYSTSGALSYAWNGLTHLRGALVAPMALIAVGTLVVAGVCLAVLPGLPWDRPRILLFNGLAKEHLILVLMAMLVAGWAVLAQGILARGLLAFTEGHRPSRAVFFDGPWIWSLVRLAWRFCVPLVFAIIVPAVAMVIPMVRPVGAVIGAMLLFSIIPLLFLGAFAVFFAHKAQQPKAALVSSMYMTVDRGESCVRLHLVSVLLLVAGLLFFGVGLLVALPLVVLMQAFAFKTLRKRAVAVWE